MFELMEMDDDKRREALGPSVGEAALAELASVANRYPDISVRPLPL